VSLLVTQDPPGLVRAGVVVIGQSMNVRHGDSSLEPRRHFAGFSTWVNKRQWDFLAFMRQQRDYRQIFAVNLRRARHARGLSQEALAADADVNRRYLSDIEQGRTSVGLDIMVRLAAILEIEPYELLMPPTPRRTRPAQGGSQP
jgi:ribosome-binding protein aMBF1 (putative translation factor)